VNDIITSLGHVDERLKQFDNINPDSINKMNDNINRDVKRFEERINVLTTKVSNIDDRLQIVTQVQDDVDGLADEISTLKDEIQTLQHGHNHKPEQSDSDISLLREEIRALEDAISDINVKIKTMKSSFKDYVTSLQIVQVNDDMDALRSSINELKQQIKNQPTSTSSVPSNISSLSSDVQLIQEDMTVLQDSMSQVQYMIKTLQQNSSSSNDNTTAMNGNDFQQLQNDVVVLQDTVSNIQFMIKKIQQEQHQDVPSSSSSSKQTSSTHEHNEIDMKIQQLRDDLVEVQDMISQLKLQMKSKTPEKAQMISTSSFTDTDMTKTVMELSESLDMMKSDLSTHEEHFRIFKLAAEELESRIEALENVNPDPATRNTPSFSDDITHLHNQMITLQNQFNDMKTLPNTIKPDDQYIQQVEKLCDDITQMKASLRQHDLVIHDFQSYLAHSKVDDAIQGMKLDMNILRTNFTGLKSRIDSIDSVMKEQNLELDIEYLKSKVIDIEVR
jgi:chromosome segregation ATPase